MKKFSFKTLVFVTLILSSFSSFSQTVNASWKWCKGGNGGSSEEANSVATDNSGNVYITGTFKTATFTLGSTTLHNSNSNQLTTDIFVAKYNSTGTLLWAKSFGKSGNEITSDVGVDPAGNVFIIGTFESDTLDFAGGVKLFNTSVWYDFFVAKFTPSGTAIWARSANGRNDDIAKSVAFDANNNVYVTGYFYSDTLIFNINTGTGDTADYFRNGVYDIFLVKYDKDGAYVKAFVAGGDQDDEGYGVATDKNNNVYITGYFQSSEISFGSNKLYNTNNNSDMYLVKLGTDLSVTWAKSVTGFWHENGNALATDANNNVYVCGEYSSDNITIGTTALTNSSPGQAATEIFVAKFNSSGIAQWARDAHGDYSEYAKDIAVDQNNLIYVTGNFVSPTMKVGNATLTNTDQTGSGEVFLFIFYSTNGNPLAALSAASNGDDDSRGVATYQNNAYIAGTFAAKTGTNISFGTQTLPITGDYDVFLASISSTVGLQESIFNQYFQVYPNPVLNDKVSLNLQNINTTSLRVSIYNSIGQKSYEEDFQVNSKGQIIELPIPNKGLNILEVTLPDGQRMAKRIISE